MRTSLQPPILHQRSQLQQSAPGLPSPGTSQQYYNEIQSDEDIANAAPTTTPQLLRGLPKHLFKELLIDIEAAGGLSTNFNLKHLCNQKPHSYGIPNSKLRKQIQNRVDRLKNLTAADYQEYLNFFGIFSARQTHFSSPPEASNHQAHDQLPIRRHPPPSPSAFIMSTPRHVMRSISGTPDSPPVFRSPLSTATGRGRALEMNGQGHGEELVSQPAELHVDVIEVDLAYPERNREVVIYSVSNVQHVDNVYDCFFIMLAVDFRDASKEGSFTASMVSETEILLTMPSLPFGLYHDSIMRNERLKRIRLHHPQLQLSQDIVINHLRDEAGRSVKRLLLRFPDNVRLSNVFNAAHPTVLLHEMHTDQTKITVGSVDNVPCSNCFMVWRIANLDTNRRATIALAGPTSVDVLAAHFASMLS